MTRYTRLLHDVLHLAQFIAVWSSSILAETLGYAVSFSSPWRGKRRVFERRKPVLIDQLQPSTDSDKLSDNASAGKRRQGRTGKGNRSVRRVLVQWAWAARKPPTFLGRTFRHLEARLGGKRAAVAVGHKILVIVYQLLWQGTSDEEQRYTAQRSTQEERDCQRAITALERLGSQVTVKRVA